MVPASFTKCSKHANLNINVLLTEDFELIRDLLHGIETWQVIDANVINLERNNTKIYRCAIYQRKSITHTYIKIYIYIYIYIYTIHKKIYIYTVYIRIMPKTVDEALNPSKI